MAARGSARWSNLDRYVQMAARRPPEKDEARSRRAGSRRAGAVPGAAYLEELRAATQEAVTAAMAKGTMESYNTAWRQWEVFEGIRGKSPLLGGQTKAEKRDEEELLLFIIHLWNSLHRAHGTLKTKLLGIRAQHVSLGEEGPLVGKPRLWMALNGIGSRGQAHGSSR